MTTQLGAQEKPFRLEEATIAELHAAIKAGQTDCVEIVQHYLDRVRAYNGVASALVTKDDAPFAQLLPHGLLLALHPLRQQGTDRTQGTRVGQHHAEAPQRQHRRLGLAQRGQTRLDETWPPAGAQGCCRGQNAVWSSYPLDCLPCMMMSMPYCEKTQVTWRKKGGRQ